MRAVRYDDYRVPLIAGSSAYGFTRAPKEISSLVIT